MNSRRSERAKQRYSRELAAYTMQQWNIARNLMEAAETSRRERRRSRGAEQRSTSTPRRSRSRTQQPQSHAVDGLIVKSGTDDNNVPNLPNSVHVVDYAAVSTRAPATNGITNRAA